MTRSDQYPASFEKKLIEYGKIADEIYTQNDQLSDDMFYQERTGDSRIYQNPCYQEMCKLPNTAMSGKLIKIPPRWSTGATNSTAARLLLEMDSVMYFVEAIHYYDENIINYNSCSISVLSYIYALGILSDVSA